MRLVSMNRTWRLAVAAFLAFGAVSLPAQGVKLTSSPIVFGGSASNCTKPATIGYDDVRDATPEWQTIESDGVRKGRARYTLLTARMGQRIKAAADAVAGREGHDLVVNEGDIDDAQGLEVADITEQVIQALSSVDTAP